MIGYSCDKAFMDWCKKNSVTVYEHIKGKPIDALEFEMAVYKPLIEKFKRLYGERWEEAYKSHLEKDRIKLVSLSERKKPPVQSFQREYKPSTKDGEDFLKRIS